jgi:RNA polymerase sigma-70 factor (ECF subfamily)
MARGNVAMEAAELALWFETIAPGLVLYARQIVGKSGPAEDLVQDVFLRLAAQRRTPPNVKAWLLLALRRAALDSLKQTRRRAARHLAVGLERPQFEIAHDRRELIVPPAEVEEALASLALEDREVVTLRIWNDATFEEIASVTQMPLSTVYHRYRSALETLRARWELPCRKT